MASAGQQAPALQSADAGASLHTTSVKTTEGPRAIHVTGDERFFPTHGEDLRRYHEMKDRGTPVLGKNTSSYAVGTEADFNVRTNLLVQGANDWESVSFTLRAENAVANVWVETALTDDFSDDDMNALEAYILSETPENSYRPDHGIIANDNDTFGHPPDNVDTDGKVDILLHDIDEGTSGCCVLGYATSTDLIAEDDPDKVQGHGNSSNVLYVDLPDGMSQGGVVNIAGTIAHEYQHLIHYEYNPSFNELTFVNEGMSEWGEVINGFFLRTIDYLQETDEHDQQLMSWRTNVPTSVVDKDYQRAGLFTTYIENRIGRQLTGSIVQATYAGSGAYAPGADGYDIVLTDKGLSIEGIIADFHAANFINNQVLGEEFGYARPQRESVQAAPTIEIDGEVEASPSMTNLRVVMGAAKYLSWTNVSDLTISIELDPNAASGTLGRSSFRLFAEHANGLNEVIDLPQSEGSRFLEGDYDRVTLIVAHTKVLLSEVPRLDYDISATWDAETTYTAESVAYEDGANSDGKYYAAAEGTIQANAFDVPTNGVLSSVSVAPLYINNFSNTGVSDDEPKDFELKIWADDGSGLPGTELYSQVVEESQSTQHITFGSGTYNFLEIDIPDNVAELEALSGRIFVGLTNTGSDPNHIVFSPAPLTAAEEASFIYDVNASTWIPFTEFEHSSEGKVMADPDQALAIRARFLIPTAADDPVELPSEVRLAQNYPNPFNPATSIEYSLPRPMNVRLAVYNMLGQRVATLVDGMQNAGTHEARVDAAGWASGVYVYALETDSRTLTQRMIVLK